jgi:serine/threonine protein kinase
MMAFRCPTCGKNLRVKDELAGKRAKCPGCAAVVFMPAAAPASTASRQAPMSSAPAPFGAEGLTLPPASRGIGASPGAADHLTMPPSPRPPTGAGDASLPLNLGPPVSETTADALPARRPVGEVLAEQPADGQRYIVEAEIGRGGMGAVLRAVDCQIRREVAVKYLLDAADEQQQARFVEEAQITGQLEHPNIVPIHDLGVDGQGRPYFAMKMVKGRSLSQVLDNLRREDASTMREYTLGRLLNVFSSICHALAYAHARGVIHRDLKPANIMLGDFGEVYVMDWGLAKVLGRQEQPPEAPDKAKQQGPVNKVQTGRHVDSNLTQDGSVLGTPAYMPPEQAMGQIGDIDQRSDIYSLGAILYEMLTLEVPVGRHGDQLAILMRVAEGRIIPPGQAAPERVRKGLVPPELSAVALKALAKAPDDRYQTVEALQKDIQLYLEGRSVSAKHDTAWEMFKKLVKRNKGASIATATALLLLTGVVSVAFWVNHQERLKAEEARVQADKARGEAEAHYQAFLKEQEEKHLRTKKSVPAFLKAARLALEKRQWETGLAQVEIALEYDPEGDEAYLLKGQLLVALGRFREASGPLQEHARRQPKDKAAARLAQLAAESDLKKVAYFLELSQIFQEQQAFTLLERMTQMAEPLLGEKRELLALYRKRIEAAPGWAGYGSGLSLDNNGNLNLDLQGTKVRDLSPLKDMKLNTLVLAQCPLVADLTPLEGMPLTSLILFGCPAVKSLKGLEGMKLTVLNLDRVNISDLRPLQGMPLEVLVLLGEQIKDLEPLRGMPLETLRISWGGMSSLEPLRGMKLKKLDLFNCHELQDLSPLHGMPLEWLSLECYDSQVRDFEPLRGLPLQFLNLRSCAIRDLDVLRGMPLKELDLWACGNVSDLSPLRGMKLTKFSAGPNVTSLEPLRNMPVTDLKLGGCSQIKDFGVLKDMPLTSLGLVSCPQVKDLELVRGKKLLLLDIEECTQLEDLTVLAGMPLSGIVVTPRYVKKGMEVLRGMKGLDWIAVPRVGRWGPPEFWKLYDKGEFKK